MILADGDIVQYKELKKCTVGEYLTKLDNFVTRIESVDKRGNALHNPALLKK